MIKDMMAAQTGLEQDFVSLGSFLVDLLAINLDNHDIAETDYSRQGASYGLVFGKKMSIPESYLAFFEAKFGRKTAELYVIIESERLMSSDGGFSFRAVGFIVANNKNLGFDLKFSDEDIAPAQIFAMMRRAYEQKKQFCQVGSSEEKSKNTLALFFNVKK